MPPQLPFINDELTVSKSKSDGKVSMFVEMDLHKNYLQIAVMNKEEEYYEILQQSKTDKRIFQRYR
jgi:hypothetical protein